MEFLRRSWAEIDLDKALYNWENIKNMASGRFIMPVVKADAYGHGANVLAELYENNGAEGFAVSNINEAIKLRKYGITKQILVMGFTPVEYINQMYAFNITQAVYDKNYAESLSKTASQNNFKVKIHIKIDTGMGRIGFDCRNEQLIGYDDILYCLKLPSLQSEGIFTHYSSADSFEPDDVNYSNSQFDRFNTIVERLKTDGYNFKYIHCCNSAASALRSNTEGNLIRPGIILYGNSPADGLSIGYNPLPIMSIKSSVSMVKEIDKDQALSYGRIFVSEKHMKIATVPIGYADGYPRALSNCGKVIINGRFAPIVGRICMDQLMIDVSEIENVDIGSVVTLIGSDGECEITFDDIAKATGTIAYEIMCNISIRLPRIYIAMPRRLPRL
jgi:alanine racemase